MSRSALLIHGFLTDNKDFGKLPKILKTRYDKVKVCLIPGHGVGRNLKNFTVESTFRYVEEKFDALKEKYGSVDVYGFSMGGALATYLASVRDVGKVVLFAPANKYLNFNLPFSTFGFYYNKIKDAVENASKKDRVKEIENALELHRENQKVSLDMAFTKLIPNYSIHTLKTFVKVIKKVNDNLKPWTKDTFIVWGELDQLVPRTTIDFILPNCPHAHVKIYSDISHLMLLSVDAGKIITDVVRFLDGKFSEILELEAGTQKNEEKFRQHVEEEVEELLQEEKEGLL